MLRTFCCPYRQENCLGYLAIGTEQRRDRCFFCVCLTRQTVIFVRFCWGRCSEKKGLEIGYLRCGRSFADLIACVQTFMDSVLNCFGGIMLLAELIKVWVVSKRTPGILRVKKRKKIRKKGTRKLLKRCEIHRLTVVKSWKKKGKHVSWFDYELCLVVEG